MFSVFSDLDEGAAPTPTAALEPAANGNGAAAAAAANGSSHEAAGANGTTNAAAAAAAAAAEAAEAASFFQLSDGEAPLAYAVRVFERVYTHDIEKVLSMEVRAVLRPMGGGAGHGGSGRGVNNSQCQRA